MLIYARLRRDCLAPSLSSSAAISFFPPRLSAYIYSSYVSFRHTFTFALMLRAILLIVSSLIFTPPYRHALLAAATLRYLLYYRLSPHFDFQTLRVCRRYTLSLFFSRRSCLIRHISFFILPLCRQRRMLICA